MTKGIELVISVFVVAFLWGGWPVVLRASGALGSTGAFLLTSIAMIPIFIYSGVTNNFIPTANYMWLIVLAGIMNGVGMVTFNIASRKKIVDI